MHVYFSHEQGQNTAGATRSFDRDSVVEQPKLGAGGPRGHRRARRWKEVPRYFMAQEFDVATGEDGVR